MDIRDFVFINNNPHYTAKYGWQREFGRCNFYIWYISSYKDAADDLVDKLMPHLFISDNVLLQAVFRTLA